jgi:tetratricopeptide (TPR) repeat protein
MTKLPRLAGRRPSRTAQSENSSLLAWSADESDMSRHALALALVVLAQCAWADDPPAAPKAPHAPTAPSVDLLPPPRVLDVPLADDDPLGVTPLMQLRGALQKLKDERGRLNSDHLQAVQSVQDNQTSDGQELAALRLKLGGLLTQFGALQRDPPRPSAVLHPEPKKVDTIPSPVTPAAPLPEVKPAPAAVEPTPPETKRVLPDFSKAVDPLALAQALYRAGNYEAALQAYRLLPQEGLRAEQRAPLQYMIAACLRKLGKNDDAALLFREVANVRGDEELAQCAQWQLTLMRWQRETQEQLRQARERRLALEKQP